MFPEKARRRHFLCCGRFIYIMVHTLFHFKLCPFVVVIYHTFHITRDLFIVSRRNNQINITCFIKCLLHWLILMFHSFSLEFIVLTSVHLQK